MKIRLFGAAREVGRSCAFATNKGKSVFFDSGLKIFEETEEDEGIRQQDMLKNKEKYPMDHNLKADALFLSHAHLDHSGALPLYKSRGAPYKVFGTEMTAQLSDLLVRDSYKIDRINKLPMLYKKSDITRTFNEMSYIANGTKTSYRGIPFEFFHAGHIPGSSSIKVNLDGKTIVYTGDIKVNDTQLMRGADYDYENPDAMIIESTYGDRDHPNREEQENDFIMNIRQTINDGGSVIIPAFAVGRMQEILLLLSKEDFGVPIYLDGMGKKVTEILIDAPYTIKNAELLRQQYSEAKKVGYMRQRKQIVNRQCIIITTSGMLSGGPIIEYLKHMNRPQNTILLTGYQAEGTNGRTLLEKGIVDLDGRKHRIACKYKKYDFSAHAGREELHKIIKKNNPQHIVLNHGDPSGINALYTWAKENGFKAYEPTIGKEVKFDE